MKVAIVILNYNGEKLLKDFLPSVIRYKPDFAEVIVADNASTDGSLLLLNSNFPDIKIIEMASNTGFAGGYNNALKLVNSEYYVLLNSDIEVTEHWIEPVIEFMDNHADVAACQPKIRSYQDKHLFEHAGASGGYIDHLGYPFCRGRMFTSLEIDHSQYNTPVEIFWATGACMFIRSKVFHAHEGFDEKFFAHMEEIDLCWRMKKNHLKLWCIPSSTVYHVGGGTLPKANPHKTYLNFRNNLMMLIKNLPDDRYYKVLSIRFILDLLAALKFLLNGNWRDAVSVLRAYQYLLENRLEIAEKRKKGKGGDNFPSCIYRGSLVVDYYLRNKKKFTDLNNLHFF